MQGGRGEGVGLALLPGQALAVHEIERHVDHVQQPPPRDRGAGRRGRRARPQLVELEVVALVEAGERVRVPVGIRRPQVGADQPIAVHRVQREAVGVDEPGRSAPESGEAPPPRRPRSRSATTPARPRGRRGRAASFPTAGVRRRFAALRMSQPSSPRDQRGQPDRQHRREHHAGQRHRQGHQPVARARPARRPVARAQLGEPSAHHGDQPGDAADRGEGPARSRRGRAAPGRTGRARRTPSTPSPRSGTTRRSATTTRDRRPRSSD